MPRTRHLLAAALAATAAVAAPALAQTTTAPPAPNLPNTPNAREDPAVLWARPAVRALVADRAWPAADATNLARDATRRQLARGLAAILAARGQGPPAVGAAPADMTPADPDAAAAAWAMAAGLMTAPGGAFQPDAPVTGRVASRAVVTALGLTREMRGLALLHTAGGQRLRVPAGFGPAVIVRELGLRHNYTTSSERYERADAEPMRLADLVAMVDGARRVPAWRLEGLAAYRDITVPDLTPAQRTVLEAALWQAGRPYVWGGDWPTPQSPWGAQAVGGYDCSGLVWLAYKGSPRSVQAGLGADLRGRTAEDMARENRPQRVRLTDLRPGDLVFFGDAGPRTARGGISHVAISMGGDWIVQSSGSRAGTSVTRLSAYWTSGLAWARRPAAMGPVTRPWRAPTDADAALTSRRRR